MTAWTKPLRRSTKRWKRTPTTATPCTPRPCAATTKRTWRRALQIWPALPRRGAGQPVGLHQPVHVLPRQGLDPGGGGHGRQGPGRRPQGSPVVAAAEPGQRVSAPDADPVERRVDSCHGLRPNRPDATPRSVVQFFTALRRVRWSRASGRHRPRRPRPGRAPVQWRRQSTLRVESGRWKSPPPVPP